MSIRWGGRIASVVKGNDMMRINKVVRTWTKTMKKAARKGKQELEKTYEKINKDVFGGLDEFPQQ